MADYHCTYMQELDDVHRLLPPEILKDIGIIDPAERRRLVVVEDIVLRLAGVLGEATKGTQHNPPSCHYPQARGLVARDALAGGGNARRPVAPPFLPAPAVPWEVMDGLRNNRVLHPAAALPRFAPASPLRGGAQLMSTTLRSGGTGFFLPRTDAVRRTTKAARSPSNDAKPTRQCRAQKHRRGVEEAVLRRQQELQAMAAKMELRQQYAVDVHASCPELALPQEWTY